MHYLSPGLIATNYGHTPEESPLPRSLQTPFPAEAAPRSPAGEPSARPDLFMSALEEELIRALGTKVRLRPRKKGGRIEIEYYSNEELEGLVRRLKG